LISCAIKSANLGQHGLLDSVDTKHWKFGGIEVLHDVVLALQHVFPSRVGDARRYLWSAAGWVMWSSGPDPCAVPQQRSVWTTRTVIYRDDTAAKNAVSRLEEAAVAELGGRGASSLHPVRRASRFE